MVRHLCCVFSTDVQFISAAVDFLRQGLHAGERLLYVADRDADALLADLAPLGDVAALVEQGALVVQPVRATYSSGDVIEPQAQVAAYRSLAEAAVADGFTGLCVAADATELVTGADARHRFMAYELAVDRFMAEGPMRAMCAYDVRVLDDAVLDLVCVHRDHRVPSGLQPGFAMWPGDEGVGVSGEIDVSNAERFAVALDAALDTLLAEADRVRINAAHLEFIDAEGTSALISFIERAAPRGVVVADPPRSLRAVVDTLGWKDRLAFAGPEGTA